MLDLEIESPETTRHEAWPNGHVGRPVRQPMASASLLALMLDEIDYGMLLVDEEARLVHANHVARQELGGGHAMLMSGPGLSARDPVEAALLNETLQASSQRNMRGLIRLGKGESAVHVAVVPLPAPLTGGSRHTLVMLGRRALCEQLSVQWFARSHLLTPAETRVLEGLCQGSSPNEIADAQAVAISTVRTQIGSIRTKTGIGSIRQLVRRVGLLPPLVTALRRWMGPAH